MAQKRKPTEKKAPDLQPEKALQSLKEQLAELAELQGKQANEVKDQEEQWRNFTSNIVARAFGDPSRNLSQFYSAESAGKHNMMGISQAQRQANFNERVTRFEGVLNTCIKELELDLAKPEKRATTDYIGDPDEYAAMLGRFHTGLGEYRELLEEFRRSGSDEAGASAEHKRAELEEIHGEVGDGLVQLGATLEWEQLGRRFRIFESALMKFRNDTGIKAVLEAIDWAQGSLQRARGQIKTHQHLQRASKTEFEVVPSKQTEEKKALPNSFSSQLKVFVSHSHEDEEFAGKFRDLLMKALGLKAKEIRCTSAGGSRFKPGAHLNQSLKKDSLGAETFIALISHQSKESDPQYSLQPDSRACERACSRESRRFRTNVGATRDSRGKTWNRA